VDKYGGGKPDWYDYPNGSRLWLGGMDYAEKVLSSEYDIVFIPQAEELTLNDWEQLLGRCTGRAGNAPYAQMIGDCNPDVPEHWILHRKTVELIQSKHTDNPTLYRRDRQGDLMYDENGEPMLTSQGRRTMQALQSMTGQRYKRGYLGLWVGAEGQVYEGFDPAIHVVDEVKIPYNQPRYVSIDFGYTHPFCCQWWTTDEDGRLYMYREVYMSQRTVKQHMEGTDVDAGILDYMRQDDFAYDAVICDWDAEDRATVDAYLKDFGIRTTRADKRMSVRFEMVQERLRVQADGRPRIHFLNNALIEEDHSLGDRFKPISTVGEIPGYVWRDIHNKREASQKDERPIGRNDHGMDAMGYMVMYLDGGKNFAPPKSRRYV
jgi:phage terminase large subunit